MKVWMWPKKNPTNVYNDMLSDSIENYGIKVEDLKKSKIFKVKPYDVVHMHWIHGAYQSNNIFLFIIKSIVFIFALVYLKIIRVQVVWTVHNLYPHKMKFRKLERIVRKVVTMLCDKLIVLSEAINKRVVKEYNINPKKMFVVKHGHYQNAYKSKGRDYRKHYNLKNDTNIFLFMGAVKAYKGVNKLIEAFQAMNDSNSYLIIAGSPDEHMKKYFLGNRFNSNIILDLRFIPDDEVADIISIADVVVLPYNEITMSGSAILALSFKKMMVMPETDFINDYFYDDMVICFNSNEPSSLQSAMRHALDVKKSGYNPDYDTLLKELNWDNIGYKTKEVYIKLSV